MSDSDAVASSAEMLAAAYALDGPDASRALYARWADTYESGFVAESGYRIPAGVAEVFVTSALDGITSNDVIVDIGCGTGLTGLEVRRRRDVAIHGIDISAEMLRVAATKEHDGIAIYEALIEADLTLPLPVETGRFAAAISSGTFTHGHVGPDALAEVVRIVRPGGRAAIGVNAAHFMALGFDAELDRLTHAGSIGDVRMLDAPIFADTEMNDRDRYAHVVVFEVR